MRKNFTYLFTGLFLLSFTFLNGQTLVWPTADSSTILASQFADSSLIFKATATNPNPPAGFKGWISKGKSSDNPARIDSTHWDWARNGRGTKGAFWGTRLAIGSASAANGAAIFNSDFLDNKGVGDFGNGISPSPHSAELWSPIIDATGKDGLVLVFNQYFRNFTVGLTGVTWSEDGGTTWKDTITVIDNELIQLNQEINNQVSLKLKRSKGTANFRIKFMFNGDYYFWMVDDIKLVSMDYNLRVNKNWYAIPQNYSMPRFQRDTVVFMADIENQGIKPTTNTKLTIDIRDPSNVSVYTASTSFGTVAPDSLKENEVFGKWLPPSTGAGTVVYTGSYIVSSDNPDNYPLNDTLRFNFQLTDSLFTNEPGNLLTSTRPGNGAWPGATDPHNWKVGNHYFYPKGSKVTATRIRAFVDTTSLVGTILTAGLYEWRDYNKDELVQKEERVLVALGETAVPKLASPVGIDFILENIGTGAIKLKDTVAYLAMLELITTKVGVNMNATFSRNVPYAPMKFATSKAGRPRFSTVINYDGTDADGWNTGTFIGDRLEQLTPLVRLYSWPIPTDTKEPLSANNKIELYPNPAQNTLNVSFDLEKVESAVLIRIIDMQGRILKERDYDNIQKDNIDFDISSIPTGIYNVQIQTIGNFRTMRLVIAK